MYRPEIRGPLRLGDGGEKEHADQHHHQHLQQRQATHRDSPRSEEGAKYAKYILFSLKVLGHEIEFKPLGKNGYF